MACTALTFIVAMGCASVKHAAPKDDADAYGQSLGRDGFIEELVYPEGTARTPNFDDYTEGSYHVDKLDLVEGLREFRKRHPDVIAALVMGPHFIGPYGPIWTYDVFAFVRVPSSDAIQVNWICFPHARIVFKGTKKTAAGEFASLRADLDAAAWLVHGLPTAETVPPIKGMDLSLEWRYGLLWVDWSGGGETVAFSKEPRLGIVENAETEALTTLHNRLVDQILWTYRTSLPADK